MLWGASGTLVVSALGLIWGGVLRDLAWLPWTVLGGVALADLAFSMAQGRRKALDLRVPAEVFVGEEASIDLSIQPHPAGLTGLLDWPEGLTGASVVAFAEGRAKIRFRAVRRGIWRLDNLWLRWPSRLSLFEFGAKLGMAVAVRVVPNVRPVQSGQITTTVMSTLYGVKENRAIGEGSEFHQLRDFVKGMDVKTIDWKRSARRRALVARELRAERNHHVILALDNGYLMREEIAGLPKIDHATTAALSVAWAAAIGGDLVGYFSYDARPRIFVSPQPGRQAFARLRSWTADLSYVGRETNHTLALTELNARTPKRSLIIVFTDFIDTTSAALMVENIGLLAKRHLVIFVTLRDPETEALIETGPEDLDGVASLVAANQAIVERRLVLEQLTRMGVTIVDAKPGMVTAQLISAYLEIKARDLI
ncbi:hypothetical protein GCM10007315_05950 [Gemmobacter tilapiae]|uniref:DUF58 domain-containing protein n=1 Tax=Neogemmobacter tilapiae TaxID=875041 RepID=A0A918WHH7_9RHOB|nr:hypothetical protein GCM10007315_05950 [Gemmobacter tilapiae]